MKTISNEPEVLIIDDIIDAAKSYAELVNLKYKLNVIAVCNKEDALDAIKKYHIKVAVIDQIMPDILGTELFKEIKSLSPEVKTIMLTGEASANDVGIAMNLGFNKFLNKGDIRELPESVLELYVDYEKSIIKKEQIDKKRFLFKERKFAFPLIKYFLVGLSKLNESHIFTSQWQTISTINVGEEIEIEDEVTIENKIIISNEVEEKAKIDMELSDRLLSTLKSSVNTELTSIYKNTFEQTKKETKKRKKKYILPSQPENTEQRYIVKRNIECTPIYIEYRIIIQKQCPVCNHSQIYPLTVYKQTRKFKTRQVDYYNDNTNIVTDTGVVKY